MKRLAIIAALLAVVCVVGIARADDAQTIQNLSARLLKMQDKNDALEQEIKFLKGSSDSRSLADQNKLLLEEMDRKNKLIATLQEAVKYYQSQLQTAQAPAASRSLTSDPPVATAPPTPDKAVTTAPIAEPQPPIEKPIRWTQPIRRGDLIIQVQRVSIGKVKLKALTGPSLSNDDNLTITLTITNTSDTKKIGYESWADETMKGNFKQGYQYARLSDDLDNTFSRVRFVSAGIEVVNAQGSDSVYPKKSLQDILVFEVPTAKSKTLILTLPLENIGQDGSVKIEIPVENIVHE